MVTVESPNPYADSMPLKVFIVEDSGLILRGLIDTLQEMLPLEVVGCAGDEEGACQWLDRSGQDIHLMIVDIFLKQGTGLNVLKHAAERGLVARKVVLTNYATADIRARCMALKADRVFDKSAELDELIEYCGDLAATGEP
jgi:DNA-binding NarL/FixJ family response regulator